MKQKSFQIIQHPIQELSSWKLMLQVYLCCFFSQLVFSFQFYRLYRWRCFCLLLSTFEHFETRLCPSPSQILKNKRYISSWSLELVYYICNKKEKSNHSTVVSADTDRHARLNHWKWDTKACCVIASPWFSYAKTWIVLILLHWFVW